MYKMPEIQIPKCSRCNSTVGVVGSLCSACFSMRPYDRGFEDGRRSVIPQPIVPETPKIDFIDLRDSYKKGYDDGRNQALGCSGELRFLFAGK